MGTSDNGQEVLRQNLEEKGTFQALYQMHLLFREKGKRPEGKKILGRLQKEFGQVDLVADVDHSLATFAIADFPVEYKKDKKVIPAQVLMADFTPFDPASVDRMQRSQLWDCPDGEKLLDSCKYKLMLSDFLAAGLEYKLRCRMLARWLEIALELFDDCVGVWIPASGKLLTRQQLLNNPYRGDDRFLYFGVNIRFFNIQGTEDGRFLRAICCRFTRCTISFPRPRSQRCGRSCLSCRRLSLRARCSRKTGGDHRWTQRRAIECRSTLALSL